MITVTVVIDGEIDKIGPEIVEKLSADVKLRAGTVSQELTNSTAFVLRGQRNGRRYIIPGTGSMKYDKKKKTASVSHKKYTASAPGEPPAVRTGVFRASFTSNQVIESAGGVDFNVRSTTESPVHVGHWHLGTLLEGGTKRMKPRPYVQRTLDLTLPKVLRIYKAGYHVG